MAHNIELAKLVANPESLTWAQAYSAGNLFLVTSIETQEEGSITSLGKSLLESITREFFSLEEKSLTEMKKVLTRILAQNEGAHYSIVLCYIVRDVLSIVIAERGSVWLKRGSEIAPIAALQTGKIASFSGFLKDCDVVLLQTDGFLKKVGKEKLHASLKNQTIFDVSETLAPSLHESPHGTEAAIILQYYKIEDQSSRNEIVSQPRVENTLASYQASLKRIILRIKTLMPRAISKKRAIVLSCIIILLAIFAGSIISEKIRREDQKTAHTLHAILNPAQKKYEEALALTSVNKNLMIDALLLLQEDLASKKTTFAKESERKQIDKLLGKIEKKLREASSPSPLTKERVFLEDDASSKNMQINLVTLKGEELIAANTNGELLLLDREGGKVRKYIKTEIKYPRLITADKTHAFLLGEGGVYRIDKTKEITERIIPIEDNSSIVGLDTFAGNVYLLKRDEKTIKKYTPNVFQETSYFVGNTTLSDTPSSISIDGSVWIMSQGEKRVRKFIKGKEDEFYLKGVGVLLGNKIIPYIEAEFHNLYLLDSENKTILVVDKNGEYQTRLDLKHLRTIDSFAIDEKEKIVFIVSSGKLRSFEFQ